MEWTNFMERASVHLILFVKMSVTLTFLITKKMYLVAAPFVRHRRISCVYYNSTVIVQTVIKNFRFKRIVLIILHLIFRLTVRISLIDIYNNKRKEREELFFVQMFSKYLFPKQFY